jgi:glutamate racemase
MRGMSLPSPILVFDSGVGGLTILDEIARLFPRENYLFCCDNAAFPYGTKTEDEVTKRVCEVVLALAKRYEPKLIVIACNTASTVALDPLRAKTHVPIVGVVPAIKPAAARSQTKVIGLLATPGTVKRPYTDRLIAEFAQGCKVIKVGSSELVHVAEARLRGQAIDKNVVAKEIAPLFNENVDTVVLGCTHFPLLRDLYEEAAPRSVTWLDSAPAIAKRITELLKPTEQDRPGQKLALFTKRDASAEALLPYLEQSGFQLGSFTL